MTEEDTFNTLKRMPFDELCDRLNSTMDILSENQMIEMYGWTVAEFWDEYYRRQNEFTQTSHL